ncbi:hypothetical protein EZV61_13450 [Corallincola luteus]|uniref:Amidohydrolase 3 domain-containing protein n=1 Tax=Corallincola luteus TaxID=1775177 RepID=A0ABY2AI54_9GAMM|nr:hypothetical protein EZV61_13450 [Corallincola luteus]
MATCTCPTKNRRKSIALNKPLDIENESGSIEVGKSADFIVIDQNLLQIPVQDIHKTKVLTTVLQGKTVYKRN